MIFFTKKNQILDDIKIHQQKFVCEKYGFASSTVSDNKKNEEKILKQFNKNTIIGNKNNSKRIISLDNEMNSEDCGGLKKFKASDGWLRSFKRRYDISKGMKLSNVETMFLPANTTSMLQPCDQSLIWSFKYSEQSGQDPFTTSDISSNDDFGNFTESIQLNNVINNDNNTFVEDTKILIDYDFKEYENLENILNLKDLAMKSNNYQIVISACLMGYEHTKTFEKKFHDTKIMCEHYKNLKIDLNKVEEEKLKNVPLSAKDFKSKQILIPTKSNKNLQ
ncbi:hypothetical protein A3Q56_02719 [Intoshia linei]|uniref:DDE-1 domain-containing protein n=1 Tax=Intoshia linei TaxID=1819745 RepID=A0A177B5L1_9BILA|nr:hypothetical protein A3Q56_02719 [Intoshia linei]